MALPPTFAKTTALGLVLTDVQLSSIVLEGDGKRDSALLTIALWNVSTKSESKVLHGLSITEQRLLWPQLAADGLRPITISAAPSPDGGLPVTTSVWHRPLVPEEAKDRLARRQANAAVALCEARSRAQGVADPSASFRPEGPELSHPSARPPRHGSEPGADSTGRAG